MYRRYQRKARPYNRRRKVSRSSFPRRRTFRRQFRRRYARRGIQRESAFPVANSKLVKFKFVATVFNATLSTQAVANFFYYGNDIYQPGTPQGDLSSAVPFANWSDVYKNFYVYGSKIRVWAVNKSTTSGNSFYMSLTRSPDAGVTVSGPVSFMQGMIRPRTIVKFVNGQGTDDSYGHLSMYSKTSTMFSTKTVNDDAYEGDFGSGSATPKSPSSLWWWSFALCNTGASGSVSYDLRVKISYYVCLRTKKTIFVDD